MRFPFTLPLERQFDAVAFGLNAVDHLIVVPEYPASDVKLRFVEHKQAAGGQAATTMVGLQRLGLKTAYAGRFGSDAEGRFGFAALKSESVDTEFAEVIEGVRNQVAFIIVDERNGERTIIWDRDERVSYRADEAPVALASRGRVLHLDGHDPPACARMAQAARGAGTIVTADIECRARSESAGGLLILPAFFDSLRVVYQSRSFKLRTRSRISRAGFAPRLSAMTLPAQSVAASQHTCTH